MRTVKLKIVGGGCVVPAHPEAEPGWSPARRDFTIQVEGVPEGAPMAEVIARYRRTVHVVGTCDLAWDELRPGAIVGLGTWPPAPAGGGK